MERSFRRALRTLQRRVRRGLCTDRLRCNMVVAVRVFVYIGHKFMFPSVSEGSMLTRSRVGQIRLRATTREADRPLYRLMTAAMMLHGTRASRRTRASTIVCPTRLSQSSTPNCPQTDSSTCVSVRMIRVVGGSHHDTLIQFKFDKFM